jgi:hypothetical protein
LGGPTFVGQLYLGSQVASSNVIGLADGGDAAAFYGPGNALDFYSSDAGKTIQLGFGLPYLLSAGSSYSQPSLTQLADGSVVVAWNNGDNNISGNPSDIVLAIVNASGTVTYTSYHGVTADYLNPAVIALSDGNFAEFWNTGALSEQIFFASGAAVGTGATINTDVDGSPAVAKLANGDFVVVYDHVSSQPILGGQPVDDDSLVGQLFNPDGSEASGGSFVISANSWAAQASIAALSNGNFAVTWVTDDPEAGGSGVQLQTQVFSLSALPIITAIAETPNSGGLTVDGSGTLALTINEAVTVTGTPTLSLNDGGTATYDAAKSTLTSLVFDYTVTSGDSSVSSLAATALNVPAGASIVDSSDNNLSTSLLGLTQAGPEITMPNPAPPAGTTAVMIAYDGAPVGNFNSHSQGFTEIYDVGSNSILAAYQLGFLGTEWTIAGLGGFTTGDTSDMLARNAATGAFEVYDVSSNNITNSASIGQVGLEWQVAGFGDFGSHSGETDMLMRNSNTGAFEVYDISNNAITFAAPMGQVGLEWSVAGFGDFSGNANETDMLMRNTNTGRSRFTTSLITRSAVSPRWGQWAWNGRWPGSAIFPATPTRPTC